MSRKIFVDTSAFLALFHIRDGEHQRALDTWGKIKENEKAFITTNHVLDELATLLGRKTNFNYSVRKMRRIYSSDIQIERPSEEDELNSNALGYFEKYTDQKISFTDCLSFVIMKKFAIKKVFTFDHHFSYAEFEIIP